MLNVLQQDIVPTNTTSYINTPINLNITQYQPYITILSNTKNKPFGKTIYLDPNTNTISKKSGIMSGTCRAVTKHIKNLTTDLPTILANLKNNESIIYGWVPGTEDGVTFYVYSKRQCANIGGNNSKGLYTDSNGLRHTRWTKENFQYSTLTLFDIDLPPSIPAHLTHTNVTSWLLLMDKIYPNFSLCSRVTHESSSNRIVDKNNNKVFTAGGLHIIVEVKDLAVNNLKDDERTRWRNGLLVMAHAVNMTYLESFSDGMKTKPLSIWDPVVLTSSQRVSYDSEPIIYNDAATQSLKLQIIPPNINTFNGTTFDTSIIPTVNNDDIKMLNVAYSTNLKQYNNSIFQTEPTLTLDQKIVTQYNGTKTIWELIEQYYLHKGAETKVRAQANWRGSTSWNAYFDMHKDGEPLVFDQGRDIKYVLSTLETKALNIRLANKQFKSENQEKAEQQMIDSINKSMQTNATLPNNVSPITKNVHIEPIKDPIKEAFNLPDESSEWYEQHVIELLTAASKCGAIELDRTINKINNKTGLSKRALAKSLKEIEDNSKDKELEKRNLLKQDKYKRLTQHLISRYVFIKDSNKFHDLVSQTSMVPQAFNQVEEGTIDLSLGKPRELSAAHIFKLNGGNVVDGLTWVPCKPQETNKPIVRVSNKIYCNTYNKPKPNIQPQNLVDVGMYIDHLTYLIPDEATRNVFIDHIAFTMQHPDIKINWQILLYGTTRIGKDVALKPLAYYFGNMYNDIDPDDKESGKWGDDYAKKKVIVFQEVHRPTDITFTNSLKTKCATTGSGMSNFNLKGGNKISQLNLLSIYMMSNYNNPIHIAHDDGRFFVISAMHIKQKAPEYYTNLVGWLHDKGSSIVCQWLLARDLSHFNPGKLPFHTEAKDSVIEYSSSDIINSAKDMLIHAEGLFSQEIALVTLDMISDYLATKLKRRVNTAILTLEMNVLENAGLIKINKRARRTKVEGLGEAKKKVWLNPNYGGTKIDTDSPTDLWDEYIKSRAQFKASIGLLMNR